MSPVSVSILDASGRVLADAAENAPLPPVPVKIWTAAPGVTAVFAFMQDMWGGDPPAPYYHILGGERDRSTVSADTLRELGIAIPAAA